MFQCLQPLARRGLGLQLTRTASSRRRTSRWPISTARVAELEWALDHGARTSSCARPPAHRARLAGRRRPGLRPVLGAVNEAGITGGRPRRRQRLLAQRLRRGRLRGELREGRWKPSIKAFDDRARHHGLPASARLRQALRPLPERADRLGRERRRLPAATCSRSCARPARKTARVTSPRTRSRPSAQHLDQPVLGGRRQRDGRAHGRRPGRLRLRLAAHRGHAASRSTTPSS